MRSVAMKGGRSSWLVWQVAFLVIVFVGIAYLFWGISIKDVLPKSDVYESVTLSEVSKRPSPDPSLEHDKWVIITTIFQPTGDIKKIAAYPGWKVLIVGDKKTPKDWSYPNCIYLDIDKQLALNYRITSLLEYNAYTRKNIGFLYAIEHGAKVIYETDDDNSPNTGGIDFDPGLKLSYLVYTPKENSHAVNPYSHFGQSTVWPRGYPLDKIADVEPHTFKECSNQRALVQQGVVDGDPDVDAIYRLTRKDTGVKLDIQFDKKAQPVLIPKGLMSPYNCQNTLILYEAFWSLVLPQTVSFRTTDIWRSYWAQRLLWEIDGYVAFFGPNAYTERSAHSYHHDFKEEKQMYMESGDFVEFLSNWRPTSLKFEEKILELSVAMVKKGFWKEKDVWLVKAWLEDLKSIGYDVSKIEAQGSSICDSPVKTVPPKENPSAYLRAGKDLKSLV